MTDQMSMRLALVRSSRTALPLHLLTAASLPTWLAGQSSVVQAWAQSTGYKASAGEVLLLPNTKGQLSGVAVGGDAADMWALAALPLALPPGDYALHGAPESAPEQKQMLALGWALGAYRYNVHQSRKGRVPARLVCADTSTHQLAAAVYLVRDLVNAPANILGPDELVAVGVRLARQYQGKASVIKGAALLKKNYPAIHAVGRASSRPPVLLDLRWGNPKHRKLTLVGKGVVFDTGGLDIKPADGMLLMKKDMGGAAHVLALAQLIMQNRLPINLRVLVPAVENAISGNAFRPLDVITTRSGQTIEIGNTDAEGRVILCDCLTEAARDKPEWLLDFATLTGAGWQAVGPHLGVFFANDAKLSGALMAQATHVDDPLFELPLRQSYASALKSKVADLSTTGSLGTAGAITAALFLQQFVPQDQAWAHFDIRAWNASARPGRPEGGEAMGLRAAYAAIESRFKTSRA